MDPDDLDGLVKDIIESGQYDEARELLEDQHSKLDYSGDEMEWIERFGGVYIKTLNALEDYETAFDQGTSFIACYKLRKVNIKKSDLLMETVTACKHYSEQCDYLGRGKKASEDAWELCKEYENRFDSKWREFAKTTLNEFDQVAAALAAQFDENTKEEPQTSTTKKPKGPQTSTTKKPKGPQTSGQRKGNKNKKEKKAGKGKSSIVDDKLEPSETIDDDDKATVSSDIDVGSDDQAEVMISPFDEEEGNGYEVDFGLRYTFKKYLHYDLYHGDSTYYDGSKPKHSFIIATSYHTDNFEALRTLSSSRDTILAIYSHFRFLPHNEIEKKTLLATEPMYTIFQYFSQFLSHKEKPSKADWWEMIRSKLETIFRDVIDGILFMEEKNDPDCGKFCGNLNSNIYVTKGGRGRILPSCNRDLEMRDDVDELINILITVVNLPFSREQAFRVGDFPLPQDLIHFLSYRREEVKRNMPTWFLLDHPTMWTPQEAVNFTYHLKTLRLEYPKFGQAFRRVFITRSYIFANWQKRLNKPDVPDVYRKILAKPVEDGEAENSATTDQASPSLTNNFVKVKAYDHNIDLIRFVSNVLSHANEKEYQSGDNGGVIQKVVIIQEVLQFFPNFFTKIMDCIFHSVVEEKNKNDPLDPEELKILSSRYN